MEKISELMDGELEAQQCNVHIRRLAEQPELAKRWDQYHLIRDVLRSEAGTRVDLVAAMRARLQAEPTILAPRRRVQELMARLALPVAAAAAGIVIGGWWTSQPPRLDPLAVNTPAYAPASAPAAKPAALPLPPAQGNGQFGDYILAHTEASPTVDIQGAASYGRRLSVKDADSAQ